MAEEQQAPAQEAGTPEPTDEEIWEEIPEESEHENIVTAPPDTETEAETVVEESEEAEPEQEEEPVEAEAEEDPQPGHDYEKRYKDLEKEFHRRNEDSARMREEFNDLRLKLVEQQQTGEQEEPEQAEPESIYSDDDRETMEEFSELTGTFRKMIQEEMGKASGKGAEPNERLEKLENAYNQYTYERFLQNHESSMVDQVGDFYKDLDKDPDFQTFVLASPALTNMMTKSADPSDHASVMNLYLDNSGNGNQWRPQKTGAPKTSQAKQARRQAASGLAKNSAPVMERSTENMSDQELWDNVPEPKDDF